MEWGPLPRLMVVVCPDAVNVCRKTMLSYKYRDGVAIMQVRWKRFSVMNNIIVCVGLAWHSFRPVMNRLWTATASVRIRVKCVAVWTTAVIVLCVRSPRTGHGCTFSCALAGHTVARM